MRHNAATQTTLVELLLTTSKQALAYVTFNASKAIGTDRFVRVGDVVWC